MSATADGARPSSAAEVAWVVLVPCTIVTVVAIILLGPPLGHAIFSPGSDQLWPPSWWEATGHPEPVKQGRFVLAVLAPLLLAAVILVCSRRDLRLRPQMVRAMTFTSYALVLALVVASLRTQHLAFNIGQPAPPIFGRGAVIVAASLVLVAMIVLRRRVVTDWIVRLVRETRVRRGAGLAIATAFAATWLLKVIMTDRLTGDFAGLNLPWTMNDAMAVLDGRTPLVDYHVIYAKLLPYPTALVLASLGTTIFVYTTWMAILDGLALLAVYAVLRRVTRSSLLALALFVPFVATSDLGGLPISGGEVSSITLSAMWPMRYGGAYLMAWLAVRHIAGSRPRGVRTMFFVGGLVAINNLEFGVSAVIASAVALMCARPPGSAGAVLRLIADVAVGALGAIGVVCLFTLIRAGALPNPALLLEWPRIFTNLGWFSMPLPTVGLYLALYATFVAAIAAAAVRLSRPDDDRLLTSMLAWSGVFGLLASSYFIGRPDAFKVYGMFSAWSFALGLLTILSVRALAARSWRRPALPQLLVLFGFALSICSIGRLVLPQQQIARLTKSLPQPVYQASAERFVGAHTRRGEKVAILVPMGHRIAYDLGLDNVAPYAFMNAIVTRSQMRTLIDTVRREGVREIFTPVPGSRLLQEGDIAPEQLELLGSIGYVQTTTESGFIELRGE